MKISIIKLSVSPLSSRLTVRIFWIASWHTAVDFEACSCASDDNFRKLFPSRVPTNIILGMHRTITPVSCGDITMTDITHPTIWVKLLRPWDTSILNELFNSWISLVNLLTISPLRCLSKNSMSCIIIDRKRSRRNWAATLSPTHESV